jgi:hypothetical protein
VGVGFNARDEMRDSQSWGAMELLERRNRRAWPLVVSEKQPMYGYPVAAGKSDEITVTKVDWGVVVVAVFDDAPYVDEAVEGKIDEAENEESGEFIEELDARTEPLAFGIMSEKVKKRMSWRRNPNCLYSKQ